MSYYRPSKGQQREFKDRKEQALQKRIKLLNSSDDDTKVYMIINEFSLIEYLVNPSDKVQIRLINHSKKAFPHFYNENTPERVLLAAVSKSGNAYRLIKNPSDEVTDVAVYCDPNLLRTVKNPSSELIYRTCKHSIGYLAGVEMSEKLQFKFIRMRKESIRYIFNPTQKAIMLHELLWVL